MKNIFATKIQDDKNSFYEINRLKFDNGIIHIITKELNMTIEYHCQGTMTVSNNSSTQIHKILSGFNYTQLIRPWRQPNISFNGNKRFVVEDNDNKLYIYFSHNLLFDLILRKVDKECYLLYNSGEKHTVYSVFDSSKKYIGDFTLLDTGFGIGKCQIDPKYTIEYERNMENIRGKVVQNAYDAAYYKVYGPKKELETATKNLEDYRKKIKNKESDYLKEWGYLMEEKVDVQDMMLINKIETEEKNKIEKEKFEEEKNFVKITTIN
jgi:hypothetical protein